MTRPLLDWQRRKIDAALQRQRHAREAAPDCGCPLCLVDGEILAAIRKRMELEAARIGPAPF